MVVLVTGIHTFGAAETRMDPETRIRREIESCAEARPTMTPTEEGL